STATGYSMRISCTARRTLSRLVSMLNSGVWTPITTSPNGSYSLAQARTYGSGRSQLMRVRPEVDQDHPAAQHVGGQRRRVQPRRGAVERRHVPFVVQPWIGNVEFRHAGSL